MIIKITYGNGRVEAFNANTRQDAIAMGQQMGRAQGTYVAAAEPISQQELPALVQQGGTDSFSNSQGPLPSAGPPVASTPFNIETQIANQGATQGTPFAYNPEFSRPDLFDNRPAVTDPNRSPLLDRQFDFTTDESGGAISGFQSAADLEKLQAAEEKSALEAKEEAGKLSQLQEVKNPLLDSFRRGYDAQNKTFERRLIDSQETPNGTLYRRYQYVVDNEPIGIISFLVNQDGITDLENPHLHEVAVTNEAMNAGTDITALQGNDFLLSSIKSGTGNVLVDAFKRSDGGTLLKENEANIPTWLISVFASQGKTFKQENIGTPDNPNYSYEIKFNDGTGGFDVPVVKRAEGPKPPTVTNEEDITDEEDTRDSVPEVEDFDPSVSSPGGPGSGAAPVTSTGTGQVLDQVSNMVPTSNVIEVNPVVNYPGDPLVDFLGQEGFAIPTDANGNQQLLDRMSLLPGFPIDFLDPSNLFVEVIEEVVTMIPGEREGDPPIRQVETKRRFETNPAVSAALELYGSKIKQITGSQESIDRIVQSQINATGGLLGPASTLSAEEFESLEVGLRNVASSGGRLTAQMKEGEDGLSKLVQELTPLGKQELTQEALRQSGGLLGGYYTQDAEGKEVFQRGLDPEQLLNNQNQQELLRIQSQNLPDLVASRYGALDAQNQRRSAILNQISNIYQNPTQLAAIVQAGGGPLLQLQEELRRTEQSVPGFPGYPTAPPLGTPTQASIPIPAGTSGGSGIIPEQPVENVNLDPTNIVGYADGVPITRDGSAPFAGEALVNPQTNMSTGLPLVQTYNPNLNEQAFNNLNPIQQQQAFGSAAVFGKTPEEVQQDLLDFTPLGQRQALYGVGGTTNILGRS